MSYLEPIDPSQRAGMGYRRIRRRSRRGFGLVLVGGVMLVFASGLWFAYKLSSFQASPSTVPVIHADTTPTKIRPQDPGGMEIPDQDKLVLSPDGKNKPVESLLPPPETPLPRPAPPIAAGQIAPVPLPQPAQPQAQQSQAQQSQIQQPQPQQSQAPAQPQSQPTAPYQPPPQSPPPVQAATQLPAQPQASQPSTPPPSAPAPAPSSAPVMPTPPSNAPAQTAALQANPQAAPDGTGYRLQLASVPTPDAVKREWDRIEHANADVLGSLGYTVAQADLGSRGIYYRIQAGPIADRAEAERICDLLKQRKAGCILVKP